VLHAFDIVITLSPSGENPSSKLPVSLVTLNSSPAVSTRLPYVARPSSSKRTSLSNGIFECV
jgi:hypothetical protein